MVILVMMIFRLVWTALGDDFFSPFREEVSRPLNVNGTQYYGLGRVRLPRSGVTGSLKYGSQCIHCHLKFRDVTTEVMTRPPDPY